MIFPHLEIESVLQVGDKTRLDARKSFASSADEIEKIELTPGTGANPVDVTGARYLDWQFDSAGSKAIKLEVFAGGGSKEMTLPIQVLAVANDALFSTDSDLTPHEDSILDYVREGRNSFLDKHRAAQRLIIDHLDEKRIWDSEGNRLTKNALIKPEDLKSWSTYLTLSIIFEGISNAVDDIFSIKAAKYKALASQKAGLATVRIDTEGDGQEDTRKSTLSSILVRR